MNANGSFVITWTNDNSATGSADVYARQFNPDGSPKDSEFLVNTHARDEQMNSSVAVNSAGGFVVTWSSPNESGTGWAVYAQRFDSSGNPLAAAFKVDASDSNDQLYSRVASDAAGNFTVIWQGPDGDGSGIFGQRFDSAGNPLGSVFRANGATAGNQQSADIAMNATGSFVVTWSTDNQDVYAQQFNADGSMAGSEFQVNTTSADQAYAVTHTVSGCGIDIWSNSDQFHFAATGVSGDATMVAKVTSVSDTGTFAKAGVMFRSSLDANASEAMIYANPDNLVVFQWRTSDGDWTSDVYSAGVVNGTALVKLVRVGNQFSGFYSTDGANWIQVGSTQTIDMGESIQAGLAVSSWSANAVCTATFQDVTINGSADFTLSDLDIGAPSIAGSYLCSGPFQVASPTVAMDNSGAFLITWSSYNQDALGSWGVYSQLYAASGSAVGPETRVNATTEGTQASSSVAFLGTTRYVVVWSGNGEEDDSGVYSSVCDVALLGQDVNLPPVNSLPSEQGDALNTPLVFSTDNGNAIQITDPNIDPDHAAVNVANSSFESPTGSWYAPGEGDWVYTYADDGLFNDAGVLQEGVWNAPAPAEGTQVGFIDGAATIWQDINFTEAGNYAISFQGAHRDYSNTDSLTNPIMVQIDGVTVGVIEPDSVNLEGYRTDSFAVTAGVHRVSFIGMSADSEDCVTFIDRVSIAKTESLVSVTLSVDHGTLSLACLNVNAQRMADNGLVFSAGSGEDDTTMTFTGTLADVNAALNGLQYMPDANFEGTAHLTIATNDMDSAAVGGAKTTTNILAINVSAPSQYSGLLGSYVNVTDLALGKTATESSDPWGYPASNAVNGDLSDFSHTLNNSNEWWQVDLSPGTDTQMTQIVVYNRDVCGDRLSNFTISVIDSNGNTVWSEVYTQPTTDGERLVFDTGTISGEYVRIQKNDANYLHLVEVQVFDYTPVTRVDPTVNFNWGIETSPAPGIPGANWQASWQGTVTADYSEDYTFYATADDGVRLWVNGQLLCDGWQPQGATEYSGTIHLDAGQSYSICMEYFQGGWGESAKLEWSSTSQTREVIPASNLSCANLLAGENATPVNTVPGDQSGTLNSPVVFSTANGNAIQVSDTNAATTAFSDSFENPGMNWGDISGGQCGGGNEGGWNLTSWDGGVNESAIAANGSPYGNPYAADGSQVLAIEGNATAWQDVAFAEAGTYTLNFQAAYTNDNQGWNWFNGSNPIAVQIDGVTVGTFTPMSNDHFDAFQTGSFTIDAGVHRVTFAGLTNDGSDRVSFVDQVSITKQATSIPLGPADASAPIASSLAFSSGFENPQFAWGANSGGGNVGGWNFTTWYQDSRGGNTSSAIVANGSGYNNPDAPVGSQAAGIEGFGSVWQDVNFTEAGNYTIDFLAAFRDVDAWWCSGPNPISVAVDGVQVAVITPTSGDHYDAYQTGSFTVAAGVHRISFTGLNPNANYVTSFIDEVSIVKNADALQVNLSSPGGMLTLGQTDGLVFLSGDGVDDSSMTFLGTVDDINAALDGLQFLPAAANFVGTTEVQITTTDLAPSLNGGPQSSTSTVAVTTSVPTSYQGLLGEYDSDQWYAVLPTDRIDSTIDFTWDSGASPAPGVAANSFVASWTGQIQATSSGTYTFRVTADDSGWLYVNGQQVCSASVGSAEGTIDLVAGQWYSFEFDYQQNGGPGQAKVEWLQPGQDQWQVIPASQLSCANLFQNENQAPVNNVPGEQTGSLNTSLVFSPDNGNGISVSDADTNYNRPVEVTLSVDHGTLTLNSTAWLDFLVGDGTNDSTMTFTGWTSDINWALFNLTYTPSVDFVGTAQLTITTNDEAPLFANGGAKSTTDTVAINVPAPSEYSGLLGTYYNCADLALGKTATQSSDYGGYPASNVVDGDLNNFNITQPGANEWWQVDLSPGTDTQLTQIVLSAPTSYGTWLNNFTVSVIDSNGNTVWSEVYNQPTTDGQRIVFETGRISGEYVRIQENNSNYLIVGEVQVFDYAPVTRIDPTVNFDWGNQGSPAPEISGTNWKATWQGAVTPDSSGDYTFYVTADDGVRLWVNGQLLCDGWVDQGATEYSNATPIYLEAGQSYSIRMDYYQGGGGESAKLEWSSASVAREVIPASNLSCADLVQARQAVAVNVVPGDQGVAINTPLVFSSAHDNAISISESDVDQGTSFVPVGNSDFESPGLNDGDYVCGGTYGGWNLQALTPNADGTYSDGAIVSNNNSSWYGTFTPAPTGQQVACIESQGTMWQDVTFTEAGSYTLSLLAAHSPSGYYWGASPTNPILVQVDGQSVGVIYPDSTDYKEYQTNAFTVTAGVHRVSFTGLCPAGDDTETFIDDVAITKTNSVVQVTLSADHGALNLAQTSGLAFTSGNGQNDASMTFLGTVDDINAALDGLQLMPDANFQGVCNVTIATDNLASAVSGGEQTTTDTVAVNVSVPTEYSGLLATYYDNTDLSGTGVQRIDPSIDFSMGEVSPAPDVPGTYWSACWQGKIQATVTGTYTFYVTGDDGVRLWVNDAAVDGWNYQSATTYTLTTDLVAGQWYTVQMQYFQGGVDEVAKLEWSATDADGNLILSREVVPTSQLNCENTAPVNTVPDQQTTDESTPLYFSSANGNAIQVSDVDTVNGTLEVTLAVDHGTLTLSGTDGLTFTSGGNATSAMTFSGARSDVNAALDGLCFTPAVSESGGYISAADLTITTNDMAPLFTGGPKTTTSTVSIAITAPWQYNGLLGTYYNNADFSGTSVQRVDSTINFDWGSGNSPMSGIDGSSWSARWLGTITANETGTYTFYTTANDGVQLWVDGELLIDHLNNTGTDSYQATIELTAGQTYSFRLDYQQLSGDANVKLEWSAPGLPREVIPASSFQTADQTPENVVPGEQFGIGTQPIVFAESSGNTVGVTELHYDGNPLTVTLAASQGTLTLSGTDGLTITDGGDGSGRMTFTGSLADINAALDGLTYTREAGNAGPASIEITSTNPWPSGGARSSTDTIQIGAVQTSNPGLVATYYSDTWLGTPVAAQIESTVNLDGSEGNSPAAGVGLTNWSVSWDGLIQAPETGDYTFYATTNGGCRLWVNNQLLIDDWGSQGLTADSATITLTAGQQYSIRMEYCQFGGADSAKLEWTLPSESQQSVPTQEVVPAAQLMHQNQAPVCYLPAAPSINENVPLVFSAANDNAISVSDVDAQSNLLQVTITATDGSLRLGSVDGLSSVVYGADNAAVTITGSLGDVNAALNGLTFTPSLYYNGDGAGLHITTTDLGTGRTADGSLPITVVAVNQAPSIELPGSPTIFDNQIVTFSAENAIVIGDPDIDPQASPVTLVNGGFELFEPGTTPNGTGYYSDQFHGTIPGWTLMPMYWTNNGTVPNSSGLAGNGAGIGNPNSIDGTQVAYIQGGASISQNVSFAEAGTYTISFDAAYRQYGGRHAFSVLVDGVNVGTFNPTSLSFSGYTATFTVSAGTHRITFQGASDTTVFPDKTAFIDNVSIAKTSSLVQVSLSVDHGTLNVADRNGLVFNSGDGVDDASMMFTGSLADVNAALNSLQFTPFANYTGVANLRITSNDLGNTGLGGPKSTTKTLAINVVALNDAPWNSVPSTTQGAYGNQALVFSAGGGNGITVGDPDAANFPIQVTLSVNNGTLTLYGTQGLTITAGANGSNEVTVQGTITAINAALNGLSYTANPGYIGHDTLSIHTDDLGNCGYSEPPSLTCDSTVDINVLGGPVVNTTAGGTQATSWQSPQAVAADADGNYVVVWTSNQGGNGWDVYARRYNASGIAQGNEFLVNSADASGDHSTGDQMYAAVATNADGSFIVTWTDLNGADGAADVYAKVYNADGTAGATRSWSIRPLSATRCTARWRRTPAAASSSFGRARGKTATAGESMASGSTVPAISPVPSSRSIRPQPAIRCSPVRPWTPAETSPSSGKVEAKIAAGTSTDNDSTRRATLSAPRFRSTLLTSAATQNANIGMNAAGDFVVSWTGNGQDIFAKQYSADGSVDPTYTVTGCGSDIWFDSDQFNYASTEVSGDVTMTATVTSATDTGDFRQVRRDVPRQPGSECCACDDLRHPRQPRRLPLAPGRRCGLQRRVFAGQHRRHGHGQAGPLGRRLQWILQHRRRRHLDTARHDQDDRDGRHDPGGPCRQLMGRQQRLHRYLHGT